MADREDGAWFAPKRYGFGAGLPIAWQGWALLLGTIGQIDVLRRLDPDHERDARPSIYS